MKTAMAVQLQSNPVWSGADYWPELGRVVEQFIGQPCAPSCSSDEAADLASVQVEQLLLRLLAELAGQPTTPAGLPAMLARYQALFAASPRPCFLVAQEIKALFDTARLILAAHRRELRGALGAERRQMIGLLLRQSARAYHWDCERQIHSGRFGELPTMHVLDLLALAQQYYSSAPFEASQ